MTRGIQGADHVWLVMMKAMRALTRYAAAGIEETGLGLSDFGVLEALLHKGALPVNTIGPIVLTGKAPLCSRASSTPKSERPSPVSSIPAAAYLVRARIAFIITSQTWSAP